MQADLSSARSAAALSGLRPGDPGYTYAEGFADSLISGLKLGPLDIHPGLSLGWEYSNQTYNAAPTTPSNDSSYFIAPTLALNYSREIGPWSVSAAYSAGIRYYLNRNYTAAGTGNQRNPFTQTASFLVGHLGARHSLTLSGAGSSGSGFDAVSGGNIVQTNLGVVGDYRYSLLTYVDDGAKANYSASMNQGAQNGGASSGDGNLGSYKGGVWAEWLATGKTKLRWDFDAGQSSQNLTNQQTSTPQRSNINYVETLGSVDYELTGKLRLKTGLGVGYRTAPQTTQSQYTGIQPRYSLEATYNPTEKTLLSASFSLLGADLKPNYRFSATWQPRVNTGLSLAIYQTQEFSLSTVNQVQVSRGVIGSISQRLFSKVDLTLSAGWQQTDNLSMSSSAASQNVTQNPYGLASATLTWHLSSWSSLQASLMSQTNAANNSTTGSSGGPQNRATVSFNLTF